MSTERAYYVVASFDPLQEGRVHNFPVHMKLLPRFTTPVSSPELIGMLERSMEVMEPFSIVGEGEAGLSKDGEHRARVIGERAFLVDLHQRLIEGIQDASPVFDKPEYIADNYLPHVTPQLSGSRWIRRGQTVDVNELHVFSAVSSYPRLGVVDKTIPLKGRT
jgi:hypothetical protein